jgi:site-specific recombinase XerD
MTKKAEKVRGVYEKVPGSGVWWCRYADSRGILRREKVGRRADAIDLYNKRRTETLQRKKLPERFRAKGITFRTLCADALEHSRAANTEKSTYELELKVNELLPVFGDMKAEDITKQEIVRWLTTESEKRKWKSSSRNRWQAALSLIFRVGIDNEKITTNPAARIRRKTENNGRVRFLSDDEYRNLKNAIQECGSRFHAAFDLSVHSGMRASEQFSLRWAQVDLDRRQIHLPKTKNGKPRHVPLNATAVSALETLKQIAKPTAANQPVFPNAEGEAVQGPRGWFKRAVDRAGISDYSWHCNRHTFASKLVMAGVDLRTVGELLGHKSMQMTLRYSHLAPQHKATAVDRLVFTGQLAPQVAPAVIAEN